MNDSGMPNNTSLCGKCGGPGLVFNPELWPLRFVECVVCMGQGIVVSWELVEKELEGLLRGE